MLQHSLVTTLLTFLRQSLNKTSGLSKLIGCQSETKPKLKRSSSSILLVNVCLKVLLFYLTVYRLIGLVQIFNITTGALERKTKQLGPKPYL